MYNESGCLNLIWQVCIVSILTHLHIFIFNPFIHHIFYFLPSMRFLSLHLVSKKESLCLLKLVCYIFVHDIWLLHDLIMMSWSIMHILYLCIECPFLVRQEKKFIMRRSLFSETRAFRLHAVAIYIVAVGSTFSLNYELVKAPSS